MPALPLRSRSSNKAAALIIVLAFVVLLTGLSLAYLSRATSDRQQGQSSYNNTSAGLLARSALDIVVGDFQQEIVNGSNPTYVSGTKIYIPINALNMVPQRSGNVVAAPNLIRRSVHSDGINFPGVASRASAVNSQDNPSANGRYISSTRWNEHYLVPKGNTATADSSPIPAFTLATPDWVIVTRAGPTPFASWDATLANPTNNNYAIGRYAYAVYDEGGLLEINVAGYPVPPTPLPAYLTDIGRKGSVAWADLRSLVTPTPTGTPINTKISGFRNYATTGQNNVSNFNFSFTNNTQIESFVSYFLGSQSPPGTPIPINSARVGTNRDFIAVNPTLAADGRTDQGFTTRAELINFFNSTNISVNILQYLGTFSREQNKPTLPLTPAWPSPSPSPSPSWQRIVLPQRFYLGNLNEVVDGGNAANIRTYIGLQWANTVTSGAGPCDSQIRWKYVGSPTAPCPGATATPTVTATPTATPTATASATPLSFIPALPCDLTKLDFFQYINYALFGVTYDDNSHIPYTLGIGAALIDMYDTETKFISGMYYSTPPPSPTPTGTPSASPTVTPTPCDAIAPPPYIVYGAEVTSSTARSGAPTGIPPPPSPDPLSSSDGPPSVNLGFRNAGEFGWAYSILNAANNHNSSSAPKYLIDFKDAYDPVNPDPTQRNPDPALLDFFTFNSAPVRSGIVSLNTRQVPVLAAILAQAVYGGTGFVLSTTQAQNAANSIVNDATNGTIVKPAMSRADIARFASLVSSAPFNGTPTQDRKDTFARVFSETTQTRTWGLLIDLVAQTGHYKPNATGLADFVVEGEKRYWLHIAIDRFDGSIVGQQLEEVTE